MASREELLAQAKEIQHQKLLVQAKAIQAQRMAQSEPPQQQEAQQDEGPLDTAKRLGLEGLQTAGKALDYAGGITRTGLAAPFLKGVTAKDVLNAFKANPLSGEEILKRAGVEKGGSLSNVMPGLYSDTGDEWLKFQKGGLLDPTKRGAEGLALEMATDPLALAGIGTRGVAKTALAAGKPLTAAEKVLQVATRPIGYGLEEAGKNRYASALRNVDESLKAAGKPPISQTFLEKGMPIGNMQSLRDKAKGFATEAGQTMENIEKQAAQKGATVNMLPAMDDAISMAADMRKSPHPEVRAAGEKLDEITLSYLEKGEKVPVDQARKWSTEANELAGQQAFNPMTSNNVPFSSEMNREIGQGLKGQVYNSIENASPELNDSYLQANKQYSTLASKDARRELKTAAKAERRKNKITLVDAMIGGTGLAHPEMAAGILALKKSAELGNSTLGRTSVGKGLYNLGNYGDQLLRRPSVWQDIYNNNGEEQ